MRGKGAVALCALIVLGAGGCGERSTRVAVPTLVDRTPEEMVGIVAESGGRRARLTHEGRGVWTAAPGTTPEASTIMYDAQKALFPLRAYHQVEIDPDDPEFGLQDAGLVVVMTDRSGRRHRIEIGAETFNGEGAYARRPGDGRMAFLVPRRVVNDLRSLVAGRLISPPHPVEQQIDAIAERAERAVDVPDLWLRQAVEAGSEIPEELR